MTKINTILVLLLFLIIILFFSLYFFNSYLEQHSNKKNIVGYIHVCQKGDWKKSYNLLIESIKKSGLYDNVTEIRLGIINDYGKLIDDKLFNDDKMKIIYVGNSKEYERPTLLHMKKSSNIDFDNTVYFYLHTKGIKHFNTKYENDVIKWIRDMLYWNIELWENAINKLNNYETYGCNYNGIHYAGNFWWATKKHIEKLPNEIPDYYTAPEDWVTTNKDNIYCVNNCQDDFKSPYPPELYK